MCLHAQGFTGPGYQREQPLPSPAGTNIGYRWLLILLNRLPPFHPCSAATPIYSNIRSGGLNVSPVFLRAIAPTLRERPNSHHWAYAARG